MSGGVLLVEPGVPAAALLGELHRACFADPDITGPAWDPDSFASLLALPGTFALVAAEGGDGHDGGSGRPLGLILARTAADEGEILTIGVLPEVRRGGVARRLVAAALDRARTAGAATLFLEVAETNEPARGLYAALGFAQVGRRRGYYRLGGRPVDAIMMSRPTDTPSPAAG